VVENKVILGGGIAEDYKLLYQSNGEATAAINSSKSFDEYIYMLGVKGTLMSFIKLKMTADQLNNIRLGKRNDIKIDVNRFPNFNLYYGLEDKEERQHILNILGRILSIIKLI
jgi:hypothetical protein